MTTPITPTVRAILKPLKGHHPEYVFTYVAQRRHNPRTRRALSERAAVNHLLGRQERLEGAAQALWHHGFRFHDVRHDVGTKLLRATGNLKLVQRALDHADLKTTTRYAHVLDEEVGQALDLLGGPATRPRHRVPSSVPSEVAMRRPKA